MIANTLAIDVGGTKIAAGMVGSDGSVSSRAEILTRAGDGSERVLERTVQLADRVAKEADTPVAMVKARRLAREGEDLLLVTFNVPLAVWITGAMRDVPSVQVFHFHGLVRSLADKARKTQTDMSGRMRFTIPSKPDPGWYESPDADLLVDAAEAVGFSVDAVIVDEGQDFAPHHWTALQILLSDPAAGGVPRVLRSAPVALSVRLGGAVRQDEL